MILHTETFNEKYFLFVFYNFLNYSIPKNIQLKTSCVLGLKIFVHFPSFQRKVFPNLNTFRFQRAELLY